MTVGRVHVWGLETILGVFSVKHQNHIWDSSVAGSLLGALCAVPLPAELLSKLLHGAMCCMSRVTTIGKELSLEVRFDAWLGVTFIR